MLDPLFRFIMTLLIAHGATAEEPKCGEIPVFKKGNFVKADYRIVGGENAIKGEFPWQVALFHQGIQVCGGSVIASKWILTAAHCVKQNFGTYMIKAGEYNLKGPEGIEQEMDILRVVKHPHYDIPTYDNDIAILEMVGRLNYTKYVQPICLPEPNELPGRGIECHISGWGKVSTAIPRSNILQKISLPVNDFDGCKRQFDRYYPPTGKRDHPRVNNNMICAGFPEGGIDACKGDSGGPMACLKTIGSAMVLYGITSWGIGCGNKLPGYYTRVGNYVTWIREIMSGLPSNGNSDPCSGSGMVMKGQLPLTIESKGFGGTNLYPGGSHCTWTVELSGSIESHGALIKFLEFDVEDDRTCNYDYVKVFSGEDTDILLGTFCGKTLPTALRSRNSLKFKVVFHSDDNVNFKGFRAEFVRFRKEALEESNCGSLGHIKTRRQKLFPQSGAIASVQYPENYLSNTECVWNIRTTPGRRIELTFEDIELEVPNGSDKCTSDSLTVYNAKRDIPGREIGSAMCGTYGSRFKVTSSGRHVTIKFKADNESESRGFKAKYRTINANGTSPELQIPKSLESVARSQNDGEYEEACGISSWDNIHRSDSSRPRLVEGEEIAANSFPWAAHVHYCFRNSSSNQTDEKICKICDGTLIDKKWVATIAHCFEDDVNLVFLKVVLGDHDKDVEEEYESVLNTSRYVVYPTYNRTAQPTNDIALVELKDPIKPCKQIRPICLPSPDICFTPGTVCVSAGWGGPAAYGADARKLRRTHVPLNTDEFCLESIGKVYHSSVLCAGLERGPNHKDQCGPEAGGGLICRTAPDDPWMLYGIVSCGYGCIVPGSPSLYTKVPTVSDWITSVLGYNITKPANSKKNSCTAKRRREAEEDRKSDPCYNSLLLQNDSGSIESDNYPEPYRENLHCEWKIQSLNPAKFVKITFEEFDVEGDLTECWDQVTISRADNSTIRHGFCNEQKPAFPIFSLGSATIRFQSDLSGQFKGFKLKYEMTNEITMNSNCDSEYLLKESGTIHSYGYPDDYYPASLHCEWLLQAEQNKTVQLTFDPLFQTEPTEGCLFDYVELFESDADGKELDSIARLCGVNVEEKVYRSKNQFMLAKFKTDISGGEKGFQANFQSV